MSLRQFVLVFCLMGISAPVFAAVSVRSRSQVVATASGNSTVTEPSACASGDMEVAIALADSGTSLAMPSGWTVKYGPTTQGTVMFTAGYVARGGSAPSLTWTVTGTSKYREIYIVCLTGAATVTFDSASAAGSVGASSLHNPDPPATVAVAPTSMAIAGGLNFQGVTGGWGASTGYTIRTNNQNGDDGFLESKSLTTSGTENPSAVTGLSNPGTANWWDGFTMTFTDAACVPSLTLLGVGRCN